jgi:hypothetical protein
LTILKLPDNIRLQNKGVNKMINRANIEPTEFINVRTGSKSYGVRVYDDYDQTYINYWDSIPEDNMEVLEMVLKESNTDIGGIMDFVRENERGIFIGGEWYKWEDIKKVIDKVEAENT